MIIRRIGEIGEVGEIRVNKGMMNFVVVALSGLILLEFAWFDWKIFSRREIASDRIPMSFYQQIAVKGTQIRAYCTTGCLDRLTAQKMGIELLGGNNPGSTEGICKLFAESRRVHGNRLFSDFASIYGF